MSVTDEKTDFSVWYDTPETNLGIFAMKKFISIIKKYNIKPFTVFDIGSYNAKDLMLIYNAFRDNLSIYDLFAFEAHPNMIVYCKRRIPERNVFNCVISNKNESVKFHAVDLEVNQNHGTSTLYETKRPHKIIDIDSCRIETLIQMDIIPIPNVVKIDVEGHSYEALEGFGSYIKYVDIFHVELETREIFKGQKLQSDVKDFMSTKDFFACSIDSIGDSGQNDVIFLNKKNVKK